MGLDNYSYTHQQINHSIEWVRNKGFHTNLIESHWNRFKHNWCVIRSKNKVSDKNQLQKFIDFNVKA